MTDIINSILAINPNAEVTVNAEDVKQITWHNDTTPISEADILAKQKELQTAYDNNAYQRSRANEYPTIVDQLDDIYHNGIDAWKATIKAIKEINRVTKKNSYITLGAFNDLKGKNLYDQWGILSTSHLHVKDWKKVLSYVKYKGDYSFTTPESLGLK